MYVENPLLLSALLQQSNGVRRISTGSTLARVAWGAFMRSAQEIATEGTFTAFAQAAPFAELNALFSPFSIGFLLIRRDADSAV